MIHKRTWLGWCWTALLLSLLGSPAAANPRTPTALAGVWQGPLQLPGGQLDVVFRLVQLSSGEYFATLDVPQQKVLHLAVAVVAQADSVQLNSQEANSHYQARLSADGSRLTGLWRQPGFTTPLVLTHQAAVTPPASRLTPPYREEEVSFQNPAAKLQLAGTLTVPAGVGPFPAVVLLGDGGPEQQAAPAGSFAPLDVLADYLTRRGLVVLRCDERGTGHSTGNALATAHERVADVRTALNYLRTRPEVNLDQLGLIGHGEGGNMALLAASLPIPPAFVVCLSANGLPGAEALLRQQEAMLVSLGVAPAQVAASVQRQQAMQEVVRNVLDNEQAQAILVNMLRQSNETIDEGTAQLRAAEMVSPYYRAYLAFHPLECLPKVNCPVLLLNGTADASTAADVHLPALAKGLKYNKYVTARKLQGVNHLFQPERSQWPLLNGRPRPVFSDEALEVLRSWIVARTGPPATPNK